MRHIRRAASNTAAVVTALLAAIPAFSASPDIPILVDGVPLDARGIAIRGEVYIPAWILENYDGTKVEWVRPANLLQINTAPRPRNPSTMEGTLKVKVGSYLASEGFVIGKTTRMYLLNTDPKEFRFPDGKTTGERAHEGTIGRIGPVSAPASEYLRLSPTARSTSEGWAVVSSMSKEEINTLPALVERYEELYNALFYDLLATLVVDMEERTRESGALDPALRKIEILQVPIGEDGSGSARSAPGIRFLFGRLLYGNRQIVWNVPVVIQGSAETAVELSHRNALIHQ
ncbi:MAG: hypothetical protein HW377_2033 [Actinobacteria bacterium]|nr:hypothetical protein [Actinomycetota bacterium]